MSGVHNEQTLDLQTRDNSEVSHYKKAPNNKSQRVPIKEPKILVCQHFSFIQPHPDPPQRL